MRQMSATEGTDGRTRISSTLCGYTSRCVSSRMWAMNFSLRRRAGATELSGEGYVQSRLNALPLGQLVVQADHELRERHVAERTPQRRQRRCAEAPSARAYLSRSTPCDAFTMRALCSWRLIGYDRRRGVGDVSSFSHQR